MLFVAGAAGAARADDGEQAFRAASELAAAGKRDAALDAFEALLVLLFVAGVARADDGEQAFRGASELAAEGKRDAALAAFEALGAARPIVRWTDDAWSEAARLAEQAGDFARARRDLEQVIAIGADERLVARAKASLRRLLAATAGGASDATAAEHDRLLARLGAGGDPKPALLELGALVRGHPDYPRATIARLALAGGWERDGDAAEALGWAREAYQLAPPAERARAGADRVRIAIRLGALADARETLDELAAAPGADRVTLDDLRGDLAVAEHRATVRLLLWLALAAIAAIGLVALRRAAGSWRAAGRALARPPVEVLYSAPIAGVLVVVAHTGNPLVATAVRGIAIGGVAVAWISGVLLELRPGKLTIARAALHALIALAAVAAATYLAVDRHRMIDLVEETWRSGPAPR